MATSKKVKALKSFDSIVGFVYFGQVFDLPFAWVSDYTREGLVVVCEVQDTEPEPEPATFKNMKTKKK